MLPAKAKDPQKQHQINHAIEIIAVELACLGQGLETRQRARKSVIEARLAYSIRKLIRDALGATSLDKNGEASIAKSPGWYKLGQYNWHLTYRVHVKLAYEGLVNLGYLQETKKGVSDKGVGLYRTKYVATEKLRALVGPFRASELDRLMPLENNQDLIRVQKVTKVFLAGRTKPARPTERLEYKDNDLTHVMRSNLRSINALLSQTDLDLHMTAEQVYTLQVTSKFSKAADRTPTALSRKAIHRVFSSTDFDEGGRFYGAWWQNIGSWLRPAITINGEPTVECDFASLHPTMLYLERGLQILDDPYAGILETEQGQPPIDDPFRVSARAFAKVAFNAMVNAKAELGRPPQGLRPRDFGLTWRELSQRILEKHNAIADAFYTGQGLRLQHIDSQLAERVMLYFTSKDVPVLPVHDSFIIAAQHQQELVTVMNRVFGERFGGADIKVTVK